MLLESFCDWQSLHYIFFNVVISTNELGHQLYHVIQETPGNPDDSFEWVTEDNVALNGSSTARGTGILGQHTGSTSTPLMFTRSALPQTLACAPAPTVDLALAQIYSVC